jgi:hypothetical protein
MKKQLIKCRSGGLKQFGYGSILVSFFLERVLDLRLQVEWGITAPQVSRMKRCVDLMARHGGGPIVRDDDVFIQWPRIELLMVEDYVYVVVDFHEDPDLSLPEGS